MRSLNPKKSKIRRLPEIPDRFEIAEYIQGRLSKTRRKEIEHLLKSDDPAAKGVRIDFEEIKARLEAMPFEQPSDDTRKVLQGRTEGILKHTGNPSPGEIWSLQLNEFLTGDSRERPLFVIHVIGRFARVVPVTKEIGFAGPRDIVVGDRSYSFVPFMLELFASFWTDLSLLTERSEFEARISDRILTAARDADKGVFTNLPRGVRRGSVHEIPCVEEFHEEWREGERMLFAKFKTAPYVLEEFESADAQEEREQLPMVIPTSSISYQQSSQYVYRLAAADQAFTVSEFQFWEKERALLEEHRHIMLKTSTSEVRLSTVEGHLFLVVERADKSLKSVSDVSLSRETERISTTEGSVDFTTSNRIHLHFEVGLTVSLAGRWILRFSLDDKEHKNDIEFK